MSVDLYDTIRERYGITSESRMIETSLGTTHVLVSGALDAPPLVLLHGSGLNALMWAYQYEELNRHFRVYAVELPGHSGKSVRVKLPANGHGTADWLAQTLNGLSVDQTYLVGFSLGGWVALRFALAYPERIIKLTLLAPGGILPVPLLKIASYALPSILPGKSSYRRFVRSTAVRAYDPETLEALAAMLQRAGYRHVVIPPALSDQDLCKIPVPVQVIVGSSDFFFPPVHVMERVRRCLPHAQIYQLPECEHAIPFDQPEQMMRLMLDFFQSDKGSKR